MFGLFRTKRDLVKKPRGGSRGASDTQLFRIVNQEEEVSPVRGYSFPYLRVNSPVFG
jgi:hypothetical protein